ncbi:MAG: nucleoid occlusion protein [Bacilli bacterium]
MKSTFSKLFGLNEKSSQEENQVTQEEQTTLEKQDTSGEHTNEIAVSDAEDETAASIEVYDMEEMVDSVMELEITSIVPNKYQPRTYFDEDKIAELAETLNEHGLIQPIVVRKMDENYEIIAGERRYRAACLLGWRTVPVIVRDFTEEKTAAVALIENIQRENLTPVEEAYAFQKLIEFHGITQEILAKKLGKGQSTIANKLRLLKLPEEIQQGLMARTISERHARALVPLKEEALQLALYNDIVRSELNVKQTEDRVRRMLGKEEEKPKKKQRRGISKDIRIAVNTIRQSLDMVTQTGLSLHSEEEEFEEHYQFTIKIPKNK